MSITFLSRAWLLNSVVGVDLLEEGNASFPLVVTNKLYIKKIVTTFPIYSLFYFLLSLFK